MSRWQQISPRERWLLLAMGLCLLGALAFSLVWQPTVQRMAGSERQYQQQMMLAGQLQQARPGGVARPASDRPLSLRVSDSAVAATLDIQQMDSEGDSLRVTLSGDAQALLAWLDRMEREGEVLQSLTLEKRDNQLWARVVLR
ncbi:type II secretion system protein GspM [Pseudomonas yamanorum]|uniref:Type II secretion system protein M n=1 Tax=Pseudomonas yamanorum TaxID=515393 RepID=A0A7Y8FIH5_9PSED|nr:type II secretion system protein GspM [Pseudomonas yamanorum]NWE79589.1 type II secretion system protein M [Pseudomonas yamanorum]